MKTQNLLAATVICLAMSTHAQAKNRTEKKDDIIQVTISSTIEVNKNAVDAEDILREVKNDGRRLTKKYAKLRGITKVETKVESEKEKKATKAYRPCKECNNNKKKKKTKSPDSEEEEDCGCGDDEEEETTQETQN